MRKSIVMTVLVVFLLFSKVGVCAGFKEVGFFTGFGSASLKEKKNYKIIPLGARLGFDMNPLFNNKVKGLLEFVVEPFLTPVISPDKNVEFGTHFMIKYGYKFGNFMPYIEGGTGFMYTTQHTREQSTQWNFTSQAGLGFYYFLREDLALNIGYRYRHFSNLSIKHPNSGVDIHNGIVGISWFFN